jgi:hypothetical protein
MKFTIGVTNRILARYLEDDIVPSIRPGTIPQPPSHSSQNTFERKNGRLYHDNNGDTLGQKLQEHLWDVTARRLQRSLETCANRQLPGVAKEFYLSRAAALQSGLSQAEDVVDRILAREESAVQKQQTEMHKMTAALRVQCACVALPIFQTKLFCLTSTSVFVIF